MIICQLILYYFNYLLFVLLLFLLIFCTDFGSIPPALQLSLSPDRIWKSGIEDLISADDAVPCMGIELNIWERAKVSNVYLIIALIGVMNIIRIMYLLS